MNYFNDGDMLYDIQKHRYVLTNEYISEHYGISLQEALSDESDINPDTLADRFLDRVSFYVYEYIKEWNQDKEYCIYLASKEEYRDSIKSAMGELAYCYLLNNTDLNLFYTQSHQNMIKTYPAVHTILINAGLLRRGRYILQPKDWKTTKGVDW